MKITFSGNKTKKELLESFAKVLNSLDDAGVTDFFGVTIFINTASGGSRVIPTVNETELDIVNFSENKGVSHHCAKKESININGRLKYNSPIQIPTQTEFNNAKWKRERACSAVPDKLDEESRIASACIRTLRKALGLSNDEYITFKSSSGWIRTANGIRRYTEENVGMKVFRITMKVKGTRNKDTYIFKCDGTICFERLNHS
ncbi:hypothetical protein LMH73_024530 [Vibrio splendidus]|nr:hypothetical protein [Vibrio splendidus]MCC4880846.1 hypothetical protein [Vibrio splendidus]